MWLVFVYRPAALFSLKASWATSTAGKTLLTPTPYSIKMAFLDAALRARLLPDPEAFVHAMTKADLRIGLPAQACVTETIQRSRQETRDADRKRQPELPPYRPNVALRQFVHYQGDLRFAFSGCEADVVALLRRIAPAVQSVGKRGSFLQYVDCTELEALDESFTAPATPGSDDTWGHRASLDDLGPKATFDALNSFSERQIKRDVHRKFVDTVVPLGLRNYGPGFAHYSSSRNGPL